MTLERARACEEPRSWAASAACKGPLSPLAFPLSHSATDKHGTSTPPRGPGARRQTLSLVQIRPIHATLCVCKLGLGKKKKKPPPGLPAHFARVVPEVFMHYYYISTLQKRSLALTLFHRTRTSRRKHPKSAAQNSEHVCLPCS